MRRQWIDEAKGLVTREENGDSALNNPEDATVVTAPANAAGPRQSERNKTSTRPEEAEEGEEDLYSATPKAQRHGAQRTAAQNDARQEEEEEEGDELDALLAAAITSTNESSRRELDRDDDRRQKKNINVPPEKEEKGQEDDDDLEDDDLDALLAEEEDAARIKSGLGVLGQGKGPSTAVGAATAGAGAGTGATGEGGAVGAVRVGVAGGEKANEAAEMDEAEFEDDMDALNELEGFA